MKILFSTIAACLALSVVAYFYYADFAIRRHSPLLTLNTDARGTLPPFFHKTPENTSGSSQFSEDGLLRILDNIDHNRVIIVDLREEPHGFMNGSCISWYADHNWINEGKSKHEIIADEKDRLSSLSNRYWTILFKERQYPSFYRVKNIMSEEDLVCKAGAEYVRLPVRDHFRPSDETVEEFVNLVKKWDRQKWLHFHCSAGKGRTTTLLAMHDMMLNAKESSLEEIISRQHNYGGVDLFMDREEGEWKFQYLNERSAFLKTFYLYCKDCPSFEISWTEWLNRRQS